MTEQNNYDAFLSYNNADSAAVELFAQQLKEKGIRVFLDRWYLIPGSAWTIHLEQILGKCKSAIIFLGNSGLGSWQQREQNLALDRQVHEATFNVIPVLLPGSEPPLGFLSLNTWIDFRNGIKNDHLFELLILAIQGKSIGPTLARQTSDLLESLCPYRGLQYFREEDAPFFFGRNDFAGKLEKVLQNKSMIAVVGPSGSGKSSVVRAGLVPALRKKANNLVWDIGIIIPGNQPLQSLAALLITLLEQDMTETDRLIEIVKLAASIKAGQVKLKDVIARCLVKQPGTNKIMLIVDQWEELYTLSTDPPSVQIFIDELIDAANTDIFSVVFTVRADFFDKVLANRNLSDKLDEAKVFISPMNREELKQVIELPAQKVNLQFEPGLTTRILDDVLNEPGNLPLLEFLLMELWKEKQTNFMTHNAYEKIGELKGALALHAENNFAKLNAGEKETAQRIFLRLIKINTNNEDGEHSNKATRRRITLPEAGEENKAVILKLANAHLIVTGRNEATGEDNVELVHETLINSWTRFQQWITEDQKFLAWRERLRLMMNLSAADNFSKNTLLQGQVLTNANEWMTKRPLDFDIKEKKFVGDSNQQKQKNRMIVLAAGAFAVFAISFLLIKAHIFSPANKSVSLQKDSVQAHSNTNDTVQADLPQQDKENITTDPKLGYTSFTAPQLAKLYNFPAELDGTGQTIGIIELGGGFRESDLNKYFSDLKIRKPSITVVSVDSATNHPAPDADNQPTLDIEVAGAVAPAAHLVIYFAPSANDGFIDAINAAVSDSKNHPSIIFICWGNAEMNWSASTITQLNSLFQNGSERGITILAAAGDTGPGDGVTDGQAHVDFPASSPYVLACGGTKIVAANDKVVAETVWNSGDNSATGGGISHFFSLPEWQKNNKGVFLKGRSIPDVSANADPASGYRIRVDGRNVVIGGTSAVVPLWAGLIALINQGIGKNAGYINPLLYTKIGPSGVLRDITIGDNKSGSFGYSATIGWDACTGWGSPDGRKLLNALKAAIK